MNRLHRRLLSKLCTTEIEIALKVQSIIWLAVVHPLRCAVQAKDARITDFNELAVRLQELAAIFESDPLKLLDAEFVAFPTKCDLEMVARYRKRYGPAIALVFSVPMKDTEKNLLVMMLKACGPAITEQLTQANAHAKDHLPGGKYNLADADAQAKVEKELSSCKMNNDAIERVFALLDRAFTRAPTASFFTASVGAAWVANHTTSWFRALPPKIEEHIVRIGVRRAEKARARAAANVKRCRKEKSDNRKERARKSDRSLAKALVVYKKHKDVPALTAVSAWASKFNQLKSRPSSVREFVALQLRVLVHVYGYKRAELFYMTNPLTHKEWDLSTLSKMFKKCIAEKMSPSQLSARGPISPVTSALSALRKYRKGTESDKAKAEVEVKVESVTKMWQDLESGVDIVAQYKDVDDAVGSTAKKTANKSSKKKKRKKRVSDKDKHKHLIGKRVVVPGAYWHNRVKVYLGTVKKLSSWLGEDGEDHHGCEVKFADGPELLPYQDVYKYLEDGGGTSLAGDALVGAKMRRKFGDGVVYCGVVKAFNKEDLTYTVEYEDGDCEDMPLAELQDYLDDVDEETLQAADNGNSTSVPASNNNNNSMDDDADDADDDGSAGDSEIELPEQFQDSSGSDWS